MSSQNGLSSGSRLDSYRRHSTRDPAPQKVQTYKGTLLWALAARNPIVTLPRVSTFSSYQTTLSFKDMACHRIVSGGLQRRFDPYCWASNQHLMRLEQHPFRAYLLTRKLNRYRSCCVCRRILELLQVQILSFLKLSYLNACFRWGYISKTIPSSTAHEYPSAIREMLPGRVAILRQVKGATRANPSERHASRYVNRRTEQKS